MILPSKARQLLAEASVISEAKSSSYVEYSSRQHGDREPSGPNMSLFDLIARDLEGCETEREADEAVDRWVLVVKQARRRKRWAKGTHDMTVKEKEYWVRQAPSSARTPDLAREYGMSERWVRQVRAKFGNRSRAAPRKAA